MSKAKPLQIPETPRLRFRLMDSSDAPLWYELDQDPEVMRFLNDGEPTSWEDIQHYFVPRIEGFTNPVTGCGLWEVRLKESDEYLGWILVRQYGFGTPYHETDNIELGWRLKRHCWGKGIATEAASAIMQVVQQTPGLRAICAVADEANVASTAVMKKLGMQFVDRRLHQTPLRDFDVVYYELKMNPTTDA
jgi:RimJ/RimL family protein N-acetyltransferase